MGHEFNKPGNTGNAARQFKLAAQKHAQAKRFLFRLGITVRTENINKKIDKQEKKSKKTYSVWELNPRPLACEASVITPTPTELEKFSLISIYELGKS